MIKARYILVNAFESLFVRKKPIEQGVNNTNKDLLISNLLLKTKYNLIPNSVTVPPMKESQKA